MKKTCNNSRNKFRRHINGGAQDIEELQQQLNNFKEKRDQLKLDAKEFEKSGNRKEAINRIKLMKQYEKLIEKQKKLIDTFKLTNLFSDSTQNLWVCRLGKNFLLVLLLA